MFYIFTKFNDFTGTLYVIWNVTSKILVLRNSALWNSRDGLVCPMHCESIVNLRGPTMAQWVKEPTISMRMWIQSLASFSGLRIWHCHGHRSEELPNATGAVQKKKYTLHKVIRNSFECTSVYWPLCNGPKEIMKVVIFYL